MSRSSKVIATGGLLFYFLLTVSLITGDVCIQDTVNMTQGVYILESLLLLMNALRLTLQVISFHGSIENRLYTGQMDILILVCAVNVSI